MQSTPAICTTTSYWAASSHKSKSTSPFCAALHRPLKSCSKASGPDVAAATHLRDSHSRDHSLDRSNSRPRGQQTNTSCPQSLSPKLRRVQMRVGARGHRISRGWTKRRGRVSGIIELGRQREKSRIHISPHLQTLSFRNPHIENRRG